MPINGLGQSGVPLGDIILYSQMNIVRLNTSNELLAPSDSDWLVAQVVHNLTSFTEPIRIARRALGIEQLEVHSSAPTLDELLGYGADLSSEDKRRLTGYASQIRGNFKLSSHWQIMIEGAILTDQLVVTSDPAISFNYPIEGIDLDTIAVNIARQKPDVSIALSYKVTANELAEYIRAHRTEFEQMMASLPTKTTTRMHKHRFIYGQMAWLLRQQNPTPTFIEIARQINDMTNRVDNSIVIGSALDELEAHNVHDQYLTIITSVNNNI